MAVYVRVVGKIGLGLGLAAAFALLFLTRSLEQYGDGLNYLEAARSGQSLFHPHHLGYNAAVRGIYRGLSGLDVKIDFITAAQIHNILWALLSLACAAGLAVRLTGSTVAAVLAAAGLLVCQGFWEYATQAQVYIPAMGALALTAFLAVGRRDRPWTPGRAAGLSFAFVLAVLYHQTAFLFLIPLAVYFILTEKAQARILLAGAGCLAAVLLLGLYIAAYRMAPGPTSVPGFFRYALNYAFHPIPNWGTWSNVGPTGLGYLLFSLFRNIVTVVRAVRIPLLAAFGVFVSGLLYWHARRIRRPGDASPGLRRTDQIRAFLLIWLGIHLVFFLWWMPFDKANFTIALFPLVLLTILAGHGLTAKLPRSGRRMAAAGAGALIVGLGVVNYATFIRPLGLSRGADFAEAAGLNACVPAGDYILSSNDIQANLVYYFGRRRLLQVEIPPIYFGQELDLPQSYSVLSRCPFILSPSYLDPGSRLSIVTGYDHPEAWRRWLVWLFGLELDARGEVVSGRAFEALSCGGSYLRIRSDRSSWLGWPGFLERLDKTLAPALGGRTRVFRDWAESTGVLKAAAGAPAR